MVFNRTITLSLALIGLLPGYISAMGYNNYAAQDSGCCSKLKHQWEKTSWPMRAAFIISPCALLGGAALLYHAMTREESNAKLQMKSHAIYEEMIHKYRSGIALLHAKSLDTVDQEVALADLTPQISRLSFSGISNDMHVLRARKDVLQHRISRNAHSGDMVVAQMINLVHNIKKLTNDLERLHDFWQRHSDYFNAYTTIAKIAARYEQVRENVNDYIQIKKEIMACAVGGWAHYPYLSFADALKNDLDDLAYRVKKIHRYPVLRGMALAMQTELQKLLGNIVAFPEYANELYLKKQHQLEQERIAIERQKAEAERAKAQAMAEQAAAEKAKADAMYQQAAAAREQAQAIKDQTLVQLAQPKPNININLQPPAQASAVHQPVVHYAASPSAPAWPLPQTPIAVPQVSNVMPEPSAPPFEPENPPSYNAVMFFRAIENITPAALTRLDFHIGQLEQQYGLAKEIFIDNLSLMSAALEAKNLDAFNKAQLIDLLKGYGVEPTWADKQKAREIAEAIIIRAIGA